jgi:hypothetical protein
MGFIANGYPAYDGGADHVGGALLTFGASGHFSRSSRQ